MGNFEKKTQKQQQSMIKLFEAILSILEDWWEKFTISVPHSQQD